MVWCGVPKALLPKGNGRDVYPRVPVNGRAVCVARAPCVSVRFTAERGESGKPRGHPPGDCYQPRSSRCTPSLSACWCRRSSHNTHAIVLLGPRRAFTNVARALAWAYQTVMDSLIMWRMNSVPACGVQSTPCGPAAWRGCATLPPTAAEQPAPTAGCAPTPPDSPPSGPATPRAAGEPAPTRGTGRAGQRRGVVSGCAPQRRHVVSSTAFRWDNRCARTVIVGMLPIPCTDTWRC